MRLDRVADWLFQSACHDHLLWGRAAGLSWRFRAAALPLAPVLPGTLSLRSEAPGRVSHIARCLVVKRLRLGAVGNALVSY